MHTALRRAHLSARPPWLAARAHQRRGAHASALHACFSFGALPCGQNLHSCAHALARRCKSCALAACATALPSPFVATISHARRLLFSDAPSWLYSRQRESEYRSSFACLLQEQIRKRFRLPKSTRCCSTPKSCSASRYRVHSFRLCFFARLWAVFVERLVVLTLRPRAQQADTRSGQGRGVRATSVFSSSDHVLAQKAPLSAHPC